ncbi:EsaB/YukD family protein [Mycolicibacterium farcinogenes]|nr:EsaB/YukD family protein [Mycolicibacterium farcinogenes]
MTGVEELREVRVVSAAPDVIRVSVVGGRTQLDVALPADVPVAAFLPELARMIKSRDTERSADVADRDERRTFWVLSRGGKADGPALPPDQTLRPPGWKTVSCCVFRRAAHCRRLHSTTTWWMPRPGSTGPRTRPGMPPPPR